jgi:Cd2+/Zn2+-exporting ATPase
MADQSITGPAASHAAGSQPRVTATDLHPPQTVAPPQPQHPHPQPQPQHPQRPLTQLADQPHAGLFAPKAQLIGAIIAGLLLLIAFVAQITGLTPSPAPLWLAALNWAALAIGLLYGGRAALEAARNSLVDIDVLMVVAALLAAWIGAVAEGALLLFLFTLAGALEDLATARTKAAVSALHALMPTRAVAQVDGTWTELPPEQLTVGQLIKVPTGERVPADARVTLGDSSFDQSSLTGESLPRDVGPGDELYAGTINVGDPIEALVLRPASQSSLQKVLALVLEAQATKEPVQRLIDRLSGPYAVTVFAVSIVVFLLWWLGPEPLFARPWKDAAYTAIGLLIVMSPCALVISTPTATLAAISRGARGGVLFKGGQAIERLAGLGAIAFDKTGTLTVGRPSVQGVHAVGWSDQTHMLEVAAALEGHSTHPIAQAVVREAQAHAQSQAQAQAQAQPQAPERNRPNPVHAQEVRTVVGRGVTGFIDGTEARLGNLAHTRELLPACFVNHVREVLDKVQRQGQIAVVCVHDQQAGVFILTDAERPGADGLVARLHALDVRPVVMLTGDNALTAGRVAQRLGLDALYAELLPADKVRHVQELKATLTQPPSENHPKRKPHRKRAAGTLVGVIGDGVNDAPALAMADVSIAIGSIGSDAALENADIVLLNDDLGSVPWALGLARRTRRTITINLCFAIGAMSLMAIGVVVGSLWGWKMPLWMGVVGHEGGTLLVVAHSLLLLAHPAITIAPRGTPGSPGAPPAAP